MNRNDSHAPSSKNFDPEAYRCLGVFDNNPEWADPYCRATQMQLINRLLDEGYKFGHGSSGQCGHCGALIRYGALMVRDDLKEFIYVGETCLDGRFEMTKGEFNALREQGRLNRERATRQERIDSLLAEHPVLARLAEFPEDGFLSDILRHLTNDGRLSERQIAAAEKAVGYADQHLARQAEWKAQQDALVAAGVHAPEGRVVVTGTVLSLKSRIDDYSGDEVWKMLVQHAEGWKVWVTVPASLRSDSGYGDPEIDKGDDVEFTATLEPSNDDPTFAFGKRPTKARVLTAA